MHVAQAREPIVTEHFVGINGLSSRNMLLNQGDKRSGLNVGNDLYDSWPTPFDHARDDSLSFRSPAPLSWPPSADIGLVNFDLSKQDNIVLSHEGTDLLEHPPSRLVGDTDLPFKLLGRYARPGGRHEEHGMEPGTERGRGLVKDGIGSRGNLGPTKFAAVDLPSLDAVVLCDPLALGASHPVRPASTLEEVQAGIFVGELSVELLYRVLFHETMIAGKVRVVKG